MSSRGEDKPLVLIAEDDPAWEAAISETLRVLNVRTIWAQNAAEVLRCADAHGLESRDPLALVILDFRLPAAPGAPCDDTSAFRALLSYLAVFASAPVVVYTSFPRIDWCVECMRAGAFWYLPKITKEGLDNTEKLTRVCRAALFGPPTSRSLPSLEWAHRHGPGLRDRCGGKHIVLIQERLMPSGMREDIVADPGLGGYSVLTRDTPEELESAIAENDALTILLPAIVFIPPRQGAAGDRGRAVVPIG